MANSPLVSIVVLVLAAALSAGDRCACISNNFSPHCLIYCMPWVFALEKTNIKALDYSAKFPAICPEHAPIRKKSCTLEANSRYPHQTAKRTRARLLLTGTAPASAIGIVCVSYVCACTRACVRDCMCGTYVCVSVCVCV